MPSRNRRYLFTVISDIIGFNSIISDHVAVCFSGDYLFLWNMNETWKSFLFKTRKLIKLCRPVFIYVKEHYNLWLFLLDVTTSVDIHVNRGVRITKTRLYNFDPLKPHFYIVKKGFTGVYINFLISAQNIGCAYSLEPPLTNTYNLCFEQKYEKYQRFFCVFLYDNFSVFGCEIFNIFE